MSALQSTARMTSLGWLRSSHMDIAVSALPRFFGPLLSTAKAAKGIRCTMQGNKSSSSYTRDDVSSSNSSGTSPPTKPAAGRQQRVWKSTMSYLEGMVNERIGELTTLHPIGFALWFNAADSAGWLKNSLVYAGFQTVTEVPADIVGKQYGGLVIGLLVWGLAVPMLFRRYYYVVGVRRYGQDFVNSAMEQIRESRRK